MTTVPQSHDSRLASSRPNVALGITLEGTDEMGKSIDLLPNELENQQLSVTVPCLAKESVDRYAFVNRANRKRTGPGKIPSRLDMSYNCVDLGDHPDPLRVEFDLKADSKEGQVVMFNVALTSAYQGHYDPET